MFICDPGQLVLLMRIHCVGLRCNLKDKGSVKIKMEKQF